MRFPYSKVQIADVVAAEKHPRDWEPLAFRASGAASLQCDSWLERTDGQPDRIRLTVRAGRVELPGTYQAALLLVEERIRGIDYHAVARTRFYKETIPKGWHEDIIDPNRDATEKRQHERVALPDFEPHNLADFLRMVCKQWNVLLPPDSEALL